MERVSSSVMANNNIKPITIWASSVPFSFPIAKRQYSAPIFNFLPATVKTNCNSIYGNHPVGRNLEGCRKPRSRFKCICKAQMDSESDVASSGETQNSQIPEMDRSNRRALQIVLWIMEGVYVCWLFLLPYAPGDPVWAIKPYTITLLLNLSLNFFFILPLANAVGFNLMEAPVVHPTVEGFFNFIIGWTVMFAPLLFTDRKQDRFGGSLEILWVVQMFLTNTLLIPYMAIRLNESSKRFFPKSHDVKFGIRSIMTSGARLVAIIGGFVGLVSVLWALFGRADAGFGNLADRWDFFVRYIDSDRPGYAFVWDMCLYSVFQPWLISDNLNNVDENKMQVVRYLRFIPYVGLVAYLWGLAKNED